MPDTPQHCDSNHVSQCSLAHPGPFAGDTLLEYEVYAVRDCNGRRWTHPETILVATDLSDLDHLMPIALEEAGDTGARLILLHVLSTASVFTADAAGMPYFDAVGALEIAEQMMHPWCEVAARLGICCDPRPAKAIPHNRSQPPFASFMWTACCWELGAGASSAGCLSAL